jgi:hypothetical protein
VDTIGIKDRGNRLQELAAASAETVQIGVDEMFDQIRVEWSSIQDASRRLARSAGVRSNLIGTVNLAATVDELVKKGAMQERAAGLTKALSTQWQWMWRTTSPREEWLNHSVFTSFINGAAQVKSAIMVG